VKVIILNYTEHVKISDGGGGGGGGNSSGGFRGCGGDRGGDRGGGLAVVAVSIVMIIMALSVMVTIKPQCGICTVPLFRILLAFVNLKSL
jgi:hypothetical protein